MKQFIISLSIIFLFSGCFKDRPKNAQFRAAGSWKVQKIDIQLYDSTGSETEKFEYKNVGMFFFSHDDDFLFDDFYSYNFTETPPALIQQSTMLYAFGASDVWKMSVGGEYMNIGTFDFQTGFTTLLYAFTTTKFTRNKMHLQFIARNPGGSIKYKEKWELKKATHL